jgi:hypothetical protein
VLWSSWLYIGQSPLVCPQQATDINKNKYTNPPRIDRLNIKTSGSSAHSGHSRLQQAAPRKSSGPLDVIQSNSSREAFHSICALVFEDGCDNTQRTHMVVKLFLEGKKNIISKYKTPTLNIALLKGNIVAR